MSERKEKSFLREFSESFGFALTVMVIVVGIGFIVENFDHLKGLVFP